MNLSSVLSAEAMTSNFEETYHYILLNADFGKTYGAI